MAGLPKSFFAFLISISLILGLTLAGWADDIQTGSVVVPPGGVQTSSNVLQPVFDVIDGNPNAAPADQEALKSAIQSAADLGLLTADQALAMLGLVQWTSLTDADALANAASIVLTILDDLVAGDITDPVGALTNLLNQLATPPGTLNAIGRAGASEELLDQVSSLVAGGVPPGIVVRVTKEGLRHGLSMEEIAAQLDVLAAALQSGEDIAWGQIANDATGKGANEQQQNQEMNTNTQGNEDPEQEANANNGKKGENPGQGKGKSKDK